MNKDKLRIIANSTAWKSIKEELLEPLLLKVKDVTDLTDVGIDITPEKAYLGKMYTANYIKYAISIMDSMITNERSLEDKKKDSML